MPSEHAVRISELPLGLRRENLEEAIADYLISYQPSFRRRLFSSRNEEELLPDARTLTIARQHDGLVAVLSLTSKALVEYMSKAKKLPERCYVDRDFYGMTVLYSPVLGEDIRADICAVHGLGGHAYDTWASDQAMWLRDILPSSLNDCRIMTFGYNAGLVDRASVVGVRDWATELLDSLAQVRSTPKERRRPLILICHSLGGLIGREAMNLLGTTRTDDPSLNLRQCGLVFLATPHSGSPEADWNNVLLAVADQVFGVRSDLVKNRLASFNSDSLASKENFGALKPRPPPIYCFRESLKMKVLGTNRYVVPGDSAGLNGVTAAPLPNVDHKGICRFPRKSDAYLTVVSKLQDLMDQLADSTADERSRFTQAREGTPQANQEESRGGGQQGETSAGAASARSTLGRDRTSASVPSFGSITTSDQGRVAVIHTLNTTSFSM